LTNERVSIILVIRTFAANTRGGEERAFTDPEGLPAT